MDKLYNLSQFDWDKQNARLVGEASALGFSPGQKWPHELRIRSHHTGVIEQFYREQTISSLEGEFLGMEYKAKNSALGIRVSVFND